MVYVESDAERVARDEIVELLRDRWPPLVRTAADWLVLSYWNEEHSDNDKAELCRDVAFQLN